MYHHHGHDDQPAITFPFDVATPHRSDTPGEPSPYDLGDAKSPSTRALWESRDASSSVTPDRQSSRTGRRSYSFRVASKGTLPPRQARPRRDAGFPTLGGRDTVEPTARRRTQIRAAGAQAAKRSPVADLQPSTTI